MWGRRGKRSGRLKKQLALGLLEDAMSRAEQQDPDDPDTGQQEPHADRQEPYASTIPPQADASSQPRAAEQAGLEPADVPVDNSAGPAAGDVVPPQQRQRSGEHSAKSTRHRSLG
jgi:hypothetical protein